VSAMKVRKRAGRNLRKITQSLADAGATSLKGGELAVASGRVIAERAALGVGALVDPSTVDHTEFARMVPEKMKAFSAASAALQRRSGQFVAEMTRFAGTEAALALSAAGELALCRSPADLLALQSRLALAWFGRAVSQSLALGALAIGAGGAALAPVHRAATGNARRLQR
jgi:hypothetical protein